MKKFLSIIIAFTIFSQQAFAIGASPLRVLTEANPGDTVGGYVTAQNTKDQPISVSLTKGDFLVNENEDLKFMYEPQEGNVHSLVNWIELTENDVRVEAKQSQTIKYNINIPQDAPSGSYYGVVFVQGNAISDEDEPVRGVGVAANVAQLILLEVKGNLTRETELKTFDIIKNERDEVATNTTFQANFFNSGNTYDSVIGTIIIADRNLEKLEEFDFNRDKYSIMPERQKTYVENWSFEKYENGTYAAYLEAKNKDEKSYSAEVKFKISTDRKTDQKMLTILNINLGRSYQDALQAVNGPRYDARIFIILGLLLVFVVIKLVAQRKKGKKRFLGLFSILTLLFGLSMMPASAQNYDIITVDATVDVGQYADFALVGCWNEIALDEWAFDPLDDTANLRQPGDRESLGTGDPFSWYDTAGGTPNGALDPFAASAFGYDDCRFTVTAQNWSNWNITLYSDTFDDGFGNQIWDMIGHTADSFNFTLENEATGYPATQGEHGFFIVNKSAGMISAATDDGTAAGTTYLTTKTFDEATCGSSNNRPCYHFIPSVGSPQTIYNSSTTVIDETFVVRFGMGADFSFPAGTYDMTTTLTLNTTP